MFLKAPHLRKLGSFEKALLATAKKAEAYADRLATLSDKKKLVMYRFRDAPKRTGSRAHEEKLKSMHFDVVEIEKAWHQARTLAALARKAAEAAGDSYGSGPY